MLWHQMIPGWMILCAIIDYKAYRDLLDRLNFRGVGIIEQDCPHATTQEAFEKAKKNLAYLQKIHLIQ